QFLIHFNECQDRDLAKRYVNAELAIARDELAELQSGYYWTDLEGLKVVNTKGIEFGIVDYLLETGANDVLVVKGESERLIPYIKQVVQKVDLVQGIIVVDWDADF
ncbi:MAG: rimM, partial [Gammaproteobacteria bacterium]|nr:rimM [Gammaproteobacteria bacterium]